MKFKKPNFWDYKKPNLVAYLLSPLSLIVKINNLILNIKPKKNSKILKLSALEIFMWVVQARLQQL